MSQHLRRKVLALSVYLETVINTSQVVMHIMYVIAKIHAKAL